MMSQSAGQKAVPPSVGADVSAIKALLSRNLPEVFGEGDPARRRVAIQQLYNNALNKFAGDLRAMHPIMFIRLMARPRFCTIQGASRWARDRKAKRPGTPVWISLSRGTARSRLFMFTSTRRPHDVRNGIKSSLRSLVLIPPQQVCTWARASAAGGRGRHRSHSFRPARDRDHAGARHFDQANRQHQIDEAFDLLGGAGDLKHAI